MGTTGNCRPRTAHSSVVAVLLGTALLGGSVAEAETVSGISKATVVELGRYCSACWRNAHLPLDSWNDCTQEVLCRLLERVPTEKWSDIFAKEGDERRELVRAIDTIKKREQRRKKWVSEPLEYCPDQREARRERVAEQRNTVLHTAEAMLSSRQKDIVQLSLDGWSVQEISHKLDLPPERVSDEKYKAIRKLRTELSDPIG